MKNLIIVCEGQTEQGICNKMIAPFLLERNIIVSSPTIEKSAGGIVAYAKLKKQIIAHLNEQHKPYVTTFIDYYGIKNNHKYPGWDETVQMSNYQRCNNVVNKMSADINNNRFIPYIQLHEFEALLFSDSNIFNSADWKARVKNKQELNKVFSQFQNPEDINNGTQTAPSKRLHNIMGDYRHNVDGVRMAEEIGLKTIRAKCCRFEAWLKTLEQL